MVSEGFLTSKRQAGGGGGLIAMSKVLSSGNGKVIGKITSLAEEQMKNAEN